VVTNDYTEIGEPLVRAIARQTGASDVSLDGPLKRLEGGFDTDTFLALLRAAPKDWPARVVLRLYQPGSPPPAPRRTLQRSGRSRRKASPSPTHFWKARICSTAPVRCPVPSC